jgi:chemotaxis protein MotB
MKTQTLLLGALALMTGCVSTGKYDAAVADATQLRTDLGAAAQRERLQQDSATRAANDLQTSQAETGRCRAALDESTAVNEQLRNALAQSGKNADQLLADRGALATSLDQTKARLEELRRAQAAAEARSALFRDLALRLRHMIDAGDLQVTLRSGRMVLVLPNDVLFDSGKANVKPRGKETLAQLGAVLADLSARRFQVSGHTDDEPIRHSAFGSNWQLSAERALEVVNLLIQSGMKPETLSAAGYGEFDPVSGNDTAEGKAKNRRIEITLQPNIDELVAVPAARG